MLDDELNPWLLEVNLSPSLSCDSPLDHKIKSQMTADLLNLAGVVNNEFNQNSTNVMPQQKVGPMNLGHSAYSLQNGLQNFQALAGKRPQKNQKQNKQTKIP